MLPESWYVLYKDIKEFNTLNKYYNKGWGYVIPEHNDVYGYCNIDCNNNWISCSPRIFEDRGAVEISFDTWVYYILNGEITQEKTVDTKYLEKLLKRWNIK